MMAINLRVDLMDTFPDTIDIFACHFTRPDPLPLRHGSARAIRRRCSAHLLINFRCRVWTRATGDRHSWHEAVRHQCPTGTGTVGTWLITEHWVAKWRVINGSRGRLNAVRHLTRHDELPSLVRKLGASQQPGRVPFPIAPMTPFAIVMASPFAFNGASGKGHPIVMDATSAAVRGQPPLYVKGRRLAAGGLLGGAGLAAMAPGVDRREERSQWW